MPQHFSADQRGAGKDTSAGGGAATLLGQGKATYPILAPSAAPTTSREHEERSGADIRADRWRQSQDNKYGCCRRYCKPLGQR
eukprot:8542150-Pyramimonas_sp.AAC.1